MRLLDWLAHRRKAKRSAKNECSVCGYKFLETHDVSGNNIIGVFLEKRAYICQKCGYLYCLKCAPRNSRRVVICHCGEPLTMRI